ncbi:MAG: GntR family transcriptional regulator [Pseudomonadota bacterium]
MEDFGADKAHLGNLPLHVQVSEMLIREIRAGILLDGEKLAPERKLAEELGIAVGTLRKALADLATKGFLDRVQGSGNYIRDNTDGENIYAFFHLELVTGGGLPTAELLSLDKLSKPKSLPKFGAADFGFRLRRLRQLSGKDAACEEIWLDGSVTNHIEKADISDSLYLTYREKFGRIISRAVDQVGVSDCPKWCPAEFGRNDRLGWGFIERISTDQLGKDIEYSRTWFDPGLARFTARWK